MGSAPVTEDDRFERTGGEPRLQIAYPHRWQRLALVACVLGTAALGRLDETVRLSIDTGWLPSDYLAASIHRTGGVDAVVLDCSSGFNCARLPTLWLWIYVIGTLVIALAAAYVSWKLTAQREVSLGASRAILQIRALGLCYLFLGAVLAGVRMAFAYGHPVVLALNWVPPLQYVVASVAALLIARLLILGALEPSSASFGSVLFSWLWRQRLVVGVVVVYAAALLGVPLSQEQMLDALRATTSQDAQQHGQQLFLVATAVLLAVAVYDAAVRIEEAGTEPDRPVPDTTWGMVGAAVTFVGLAGWSLGLMRLTLAIFGGVLLLIAVTSHIVATRRDHRGTKPSELHFPPNAETKEVNVSTAESNTFTPGQPLPDDLSARAAALLATVPVVVTAINEVLALLDLVIFEGFGVRDAAWSIVTVLVLSVMVAVMTRPLGPRGAAVWATRRTWVWTLALVVLPVIYLATKLPGPERTTSAAATAAVVVLCAALWMFRPSLTSACRPVNAAWIVPAVAWVGFGTVLGTHLTPLHTGQSLGTPALVNAFFALCVLLALLVTLGMSKLKPPAVFTLIDMKRMPVATLILLWWLAGSVVPSGPLHDVRLIDRQAGTTSPTLASVFDSWRSAQPEFTAGGLTASSAGDPHTVPLVLAASHGGGIRAAYWTALVMDCIVAFEPVDISTPPGRTCSNQRRSAEGQQLAARRFMVASGVSGGGVGFAAYAAELTNDAELQEHWTDDRLGQDLLAPVVAWGLFHDLPNHFLGLTSRPGGSCHAWDDGSCITSDRAVVLEESLDRKLGTGELGVRELWDRRSSSNEELASAATTVPLLAIGASMPGSPYRAIVSAADLSHWPDATASIGDDAQALPASGAAEVSDMLCTAADLRLSTAAVLGARFPLVSPSGRIEGGCAGSRSLSEPPPVVGDGDCRAAKELCESQFVDGGYIDNSGMLTVAQLLPELRALVREQNAKTPDFPIAIVVLEIDSHFQEGLATEPALDLRRESFIPPEVLIAGGKALEIASQREVIETSPHGCVITVSPQSRPGVLAPLGWTLSPASRENLADALTAPAPGATGVARTEPGARLRKLQRWIGDTAETGTASAEMARCVE